MSITTNLIGEALRYRKLGWSIVPQRSGTKKAAVNWRTRFTRERPRTRELERWFKRECNVAVVVGKVSGGLCVRDFDIKDAYHNWAADHSDWAKTLPTSKTGRGFHVFFRINHLAKLPVKHKGKIGFGDGELLVESSLATLPPSLHENGCRYEWIQIEPFHGIPLVYDLESTGLIPASGFARARARDSLPDTRKHFQYRETGAQRSLFGPTGDLLEDAFEELLGWTVPTRPGMRNHCIWELARALKTLEETRCLPVHELEPVVQHWWQHALPSIRTKKWFETWADFATAWEKAVRFTEQGSQMTAVLQRARREGCPSELRDRYGGDVSGLVASICKELARDAKGESFYLDSRTLGRLCGIDQPTASACLRALIASRVIQKTKDAQRGRASEYVYLRSLD